MNTKLRRRRMLLWSAVPVLLVLCVAAKLLSLGILADRAASGFASGNAAAVDAAAGGLAFANVVEPHKAPFAAGDAAALAGDYGYARALFEQALGKVPANSQDECPVRTNLVLVIERLGDQRLQAGDPASAAPLFKEALAAAAQAPQGCLAAESATGGRLAEAKERLEGKLKAADQAAGKAPEPGAETSPNPSADAQQGQLEQLQDSARKAERERNSGRERGEYLDSNGGTAPDRPW